MKAMMMARYERSGASSRLRLLQYSDVLEAQGIVSSVDPFFDQFYLDCKYSGRSTLAPILFAFARRGAQLIRAGSADLVWLEKEAFPWLPWKIERALLPSDVPIIVDFDDAIFHTYDQHNSRLVRRFLGHKLDHLMAHASLVTAGNRYLADRAVNAGAKRVEIVPTVVDLSTYKLRPDEVPGEALSIGWIGTPSTWAEYVAPLMPILINTANETGARIVAVGAGNVAVDHPLLDKLPWSEDTEVAQIQGMAIGIMPLTDTPWSRGKCGYKLIQYMACGLPVVASPVGVNSEIVENGVNGFLASTEAEWKEALMKLLNDPALRVRMGRAGRLKVERDYSLQVWGPRVGKLLRDIARFGRDV